MTPFKKVSPLANLCKLDSLFVGKSIGSTATTVSQVREGEGEGRSEREREGVSE